MDYREEAGFARAQALFFELAARCVRRPDAALAAELTAHNMASRFAAVLAATSDPSVPRALGDLSDFEQGSATLTPEDVRLRLEVDYNRLFVGPGALLAPPYESFYATERRSSGGGRLRADEERAVARAYVRHGYALPEALVELPDHIAVELEFLCLLSDGEARAWEARDVEEALGLQRAQTTFVEDHLARWIEPFAKRVQEGAQTAFYPAAVQLVRAFCS